VTASTITIGYATSLTGVSSSSFIGAQGGVQARIEAQNAAGGVDGRMLKLVVGDDTSSAAGFATAARDLVQNKNVFGLVAGSSFSYGGAAYLHSTGVPVTGSAFDGPEWGQAPNSNMFSYQPPFVSSFGGVYYTWDFYGPFLKSVGVRSMGGLAYGISPASQQTVKGVLASAKLHGIPTCYYNSSVPFGGVDFTGDSLSLKQANCGGVTFPAEDSSDVALAQSLKNSGANIKQLYFTGYDNSVLTQPAATAALQSQYIYNDITFSPPTPAVQGMLDNFKKYVPGYAGGIPSFGMYESYIAADLMILGLERAGANPTRQSFIGNLRTVSSYDAGGILASPTPLTGFGTKAMLPQQHCAYYLQLEGSQFITANGGKPVCGSLIPIS
jgi:branched-chain amino acid transport system substrate-binding protein